MRYCELCGCNEMTTQQDEIVPVLLDDNMETFLCNPGCVTLARQEMDVDILDD